MYGNPLAENGFYRTRIILMFASTNISVIDSNVVTDDERYRGQHPFDKIDVNRLLRYRALSSFTACNLTSFQSNMTASGHLVHFKLEIANLKQ